MNGLHTYQDGTVYGNGGIASPHTLIEKILNWASKSKYPCMSKSDIGTECQETLERFPVRNCDVFRTKEESESAYDCYFLNSVDKIPFEDWIFAQYNPKFYDGLAFFKTEI